MEESIGSQYALQVALHTLKDRCRQFQQRLCELEEENLNLRKSNTLENYSDSLSEVDELKQKVVELTEQKAQLSKSLVIVATENKQLWGRLSKLTQLKDSLGMKLNKLSEISARDAESFSPKASHSSEKCSGDTGTPVDVNDKISLGLEDISLKLISSPTKEKQELETECSQMREIRNTGGIKPGNTYEFSYISDDESDTAIKDFENHLQELKNLKRALLQQKEEFQKNFKNLDSMKVQCKRCQKPAVETDSKATLTSFERIDTDLEEHLQLESLSKWATPENSSTFIDNKMFTAPKYMPNIDKICPMCCKMFSSATSFDDFESHVESHFIEDDLEIIS